MPPKTGSAVSGASTSETWEMSDDEAKAPAPAEKAVKPRPHYYFPPICTGKAAHDIIWTYIRNKLEGKKKKFPCVKPFSAQTLELNVDPCSCDPLCMKFKKKGSTKFKSLLEESSSEDTSSSEDQESGINLRKKKDRKKGEHKATSGIGTKFNAPPKKPDFDEVPKFNFRKLKGSLTKQVSRSKKAKMERIIIANRRWFPEDLEASSDAASSN
ncbi:hypothetical protein JYU34_002125 [Plutella xylostella]|uniref:Uncharacterized protein n=1 Tax=Plutella xylostella TaxID=51655 RepID=A0ABQ7R1G5_PLUXY|nr:hypothetical protein JYU34_002125 [Plutella xylostella]